MIFNDDGDKRIASGVYNSGVQEKNLYSTTFSDMGSHFSNKNENKLITSITMSSEQKKKYEDFSRKYIDLKQKLV